MATYATGALLLGMALAVAGGVGAMATPREAAATAPERVWISMPEPPEGFLVMRMPAETADGAAPLGVRVLVQRPESNTTVFISAFADADHTSLATRREAAMGFVSGMIEGLIDAGFTRDAGRLPTFEAETFERPAEVNLTFSGPDGLRLHTRQFISFTTDRFLIQIAAADRADLDRLTRWARHIRPVPKAPPGAS